MREMFSVIQNHLSGVTSMNKTLLLYEYLNQDTIRLIAVMSSKQV